MDFYKFLHTTGSGMASKGMRAVSLIKLQRTLKRATAPRIPLKPLLAIPYVVRRVYQ